MRARSPKSEQTEVAKRIQALPTEFLDCRDPGLRHKWDRKESFFVTQMSTAGPKRIEALARSASCERCGTTKTERFVLGKFGPEKVGHSYDYPEGYLMPGIARGVKPSAVIYQEQYRRANEAALPLLALVEG